MANADHPSSHHPFQNGYCCHQDNKYELSEVLFDIPGIESDLLHSRFVCVCRIKSIRVCMAHSPDLCQQRRKELHLMQSAAPQAQPVAYFANPVFLW